MSNTKQNKKPATKKGRKTGSKDSINVSIETLLQYLPMGEKTVIPVRRKWVEQMEQFVGVRFTDEEAEVREETAASDREVTVRERLVIEEEEL